MLRNVFLEELSSLIPDSDKPSEPSIENKYVEVIDDTTQVSRLVLVENAFKELKTNHTYKLRANTEGSLIIPTNVCITIDLNGYVFSLDPNQGRSVIENRGSLSIIDSDGLKIHRFNRDNSGQYLWDERIDQTGKQIVYGGIITGGKAVNGGGINSSGMVRLHGGSLVGNYASELGGGIFNNGGVVDISGGNIIGNYAKGSGGAIANQSVKNIMVYTEEVAYGDAFPAVHTSYAVISDNYENTNGHFYMGKKEDVPTGSYNKIENNSAGESGAGIYNAGSADAWAIIRLEYVEMRGNEIFNNGKSGSSIYNGPRGMMAINDGRIAGKIFATEASSIMVERSGILVDYVEIPTDWRIRSKDDDTVQPLSDGDEEVYHDPCDDCRDVYVPTIEVAGIAAVDAGGQEAKFLISSDVTGGGSEYSGSNIDLNRLSNKSTIHLCYDIFLERPIVIPKGKEFTIDLAGRVISGTVNTNGSSLIINHGTLNIIDSNNTSHNTVFIDDTIYDFTGGVITGGNADNGGGIFNNGSLSVFSGNIVGNRAKYRGGGIYNHLGSTVDLKGTLSKGKVIISHNQTYGNGGGIYSVGSLSVFVSNSCDLGDGEQSVSITENIAGRHGGGIFCGDMFVSTPKDCYVVIANNTSKLQLNGFNISVINNLHIMGGTFSSENDSTLGFNLKSVVAFVLITNGSFPGLSQSHVEKWMAPGSVFQNSVVTCHNEIHVINKNGISKETVASSLLDLQDGSTYKLLDDVTLNVPLHVKAGTTVNLDLNGHVLSAMGFITNIDRQGYNAVIRVYGTLNITDSDPKKVHYFNRLDNIDKKSGDFWLLADGISPNEIKGGVITGGGKNLILDECLRIPCDNNNIMGGGILVGDKAVLNMDGGSVVGNLAAYGGGIYCGEAAKVNLRNVRITGNHAEQGGGIYSEPFCSITISNGSIDNNVARHYGGGIANYGKSKVTMTNVDIQGNQVQYCGKGAGIFTEGTISMQDGFIRKNVGFSGVNKTVVGGAIYSNGGTVVLSGDLEVANNELWNTDMYKETFLGFNEDIPSLASVPGIYLSGGSLTIYDVVKICDNYTYTYDFSKGDFIPIVYNENEATNANYDFVWKTAAAVIQMDASQLTVFGSDYGGHEGFFSGIGLAGGPIYDVGLYYDYKVSPVNIHNCYIGRDIILSTQWKYVPQEPNFSSRGNRYKLKTFPFFVQ
ncbi:MAG: hypothetical protein IIW10_02260 [Spirochaetaceae bacterium]|nr:hypothetical protein [Spirochaetaceae bacterium]